MDDEVRLLLEQAHDQAYRDLLCSRPRWTAWRWSCWRKDNSNQAQIRGDFGRTPCGRVRVAVRRGARDLPRAPGGDRRRARGGPPQEPAGPPAPWRPRTRRCRQPQHPPGGPGAPGPAARLVLRLPGVRRRGAWPGTGWCPAGEPLNDAPARSGQPVSGSYLEHVAGAGDGRRRGSAPHRGGRPGDPPGRGGGPDAAVRGTPRTGGSRLRQAFAGLHAGPGQLLTSFDIGHWRWSLARRAVYSTCEHHLVPFHGSRTWATSPVPRARSRGCPGACAPRGHLFAKRPQVQERLTTQVVEVLVEHLHPAGAIVVVECEHLCMSMRGVRKPGAKTVTSAVRGQPDRHAGQATNLIAAGHS
ncbi:GTP cyclohydrolase I [Kocuria rhizophila]|nr:GTP cyclohydrolase I [Kocuria rhizophila]